MYIVLTITSREPFDLSGHDPDSPPWLCAVFPIESLFWTVTYTTYCSFIVYIRFIIQTIILILLCSNILFPTVSSVVYADSCQSLRSMFNYCSFFWYRNCVPDISILLLTNIDESINSIQYKTCLLPCKHRFSKTYHHNRRYRDLRNQFLQLGSRRAIQFRLK